MNLAMESNEPVAGPALEPRPQDRPSSVVRPRGFTSALFAALAPGALLGAHLALLLFFLNPRLDLGTTTVVRAMTVLALALGVGLGAPLALVLRCDPARLRAALPWGVTLVLALAAAAQWAHAALFAYYLPPGINVRLLKAATVVSVLTVCCFYTALLHSTQGRRYGWRSRGAIAMLALLSLLLTAERRRAFPEPARPTAEIGLRPRPPATHLAVVAIEGATLDAILPLAEQGQLPFLGALLQQGVYGRLRTLDPPVRVSIWTSVVTGAYPFRHGVVSNRTLEADFLRPTPRFSLVPWGSGFERWARPLGVRTENVPLESTAPALWQILDGAGLETTLVGWPTLNDARGASGPVLLESLFAGLGTHATSSRDRDVAPALFDPDTTSRAVRLRPSVDTLDPTVFAVLGDNVPSSAKAALVEDLWRESVARDLLARRGDKAPSAIFVGLPGLLEVSREAFGGYAAVQFDGDSRTVQRRAAQLVTGYYGFVDRELGRLWAALPEPRLLAVVSGHGVREPKRWRRLISGVWPETSLHGRIDGDADGVFMLLGDNLRSGERLDRGSLVDVAPTLLYAMGQPVPRDADGKVLTASFGSTYLTRNPLTFVPSYSALLAER